MYLTSIITLKKANKIMSSIKGVTSQAAFNLKFYSGRLLDGYNYEISRYYLLIDHQLVFFILTPFFLIAPHAKQ